MDMLFTLIYGAALLASFVGGAFAGSALRSALQRSKPQSGGDIVISLGDKRVLIARWAATCGLSAEAWAARAVLDAVPAVERRRATGSSRPMLDAAFDSLDQIEQQAPINAAVFGFPPEPSHSNSGTSTMDKIQPVENHPCAHLSGEIPSHLRAGECQGVCYAPADRGRPCYWASGAAANCRSYAPKVRPTRVKLKPTR